MPILEICQLEIRVRDLGRASAFYRDGLGWRLTPTGDPIYTFADTGRQPPIGLLQTPHAGVPTGVVPYVRVDDANGAADTVTRMGGRVIIARVAAGTAGHWALTIDPWGNELGLWEPGPQWDPKPQAPVRHPLVWVELRAPELAEAVRYYRKVCGWSFQVTPGVDEFAFWKGERSAIGVGLAGGQRAARLRQLTPYFGTPDLKGSIGGILAAGGSEVVGPRSGPEGGRFAVLADPDTNPIGLFEDR